MVISAPVMVLLGVGTVCSLVGVNVALKDKPKAKQDVVKILWGTFTVITLFLTIGCEVGFYNGALHIDLAHFGSGWFSKTFNTSLKATGFDAVINSLMLAPAGAAAACLDKSGKLTNKIFKGLFFGFLTGLSIEMLQFALPVSRTPSFSDIVLNSFSGIIGSTMYVVTEKITKSVSSKTANKQHEPEFIKDPKGGAYTQYVNTKPFVYSQQKIIVGKFAVDPKNKFRYSSLNKISMKENVKMYSPQVRELLQKIEDAKVKDSIK